MLIETEISSRYVIERLLETQSFESIVETMLQMIGHPDPDNFSAMISNMVDKSMEDE